MVPVVPVKYCEHPSGALVLLLHSIWVILMVNADAVALLPVPMLALRRLQESEAGTYKC